MRGLRSLGKKGGTPGAVFPFPRAPGERCLDAPARPCPGAPQLEGPWDSGRGVRNDKVGGGRRTTGLPYLARPALARRETEKSRGRGDRSRQVGDVSGGCAGTGRTLPLVPRLHVYPEWLCRELMETMAEQGTDDLHDLP